MCGIVGIAGTEPVNTRIYDTLTVLQHRGQDAAGIATTAGSRIFLRKGNGLVKDVFRTRHMRELVGHLGIGHVRYPTAGTSSTSEAQPLYVNSPYGIVLGHNGNLTNAEESRTLRHGPQAPEHAPTPRCCSTSCARAISSTSTSCRLSMFSRPLKGFIVAAAAPTQRWR